MGFEALEQFLSLCLGFSWLTVMGFYASFNDVLPHQLVSRLRR